MPRNAASPLASSSMGGTRKCCTKLSRMHLVIDWIDAEDDGETFSSAGERVQRDRHIVARVEAQIEIPDPPFAG